MAARIKDFSSPWFPSPALVVRVIGSVRVSVVRPKWVSIDVGETPAMVGGCYRCSLGERVFEGALDVWNGPPVGSYALWII